MTNEPSPRSSMSASEEGNGHDAAHHDAHHRLRGKDPNHAVHEFHPNPRNMTRMYQAKAVSTVNSAQCGSADCVSDTLDSVKIFFSGAPEIRKTSRNLFALCDEFGLSFRDVMTVEDMVDSEVEFGFILRTKLKRLVVKCDTILAVIAPTYVVVCNPDRPLVARALPKIQALCKVPDDLPFPVRVIETIFDVLCDNYDLTASSLKKVIDVQLRITQKNATRLGERGINRLLMFDKNRVAVRRKVEETFQTLHGIIADLDNADRVSDYLEYSLLEATTVDDENVKTGGHGCKDAKLVYQLKRENWIRLETEMVMGHAFRRVRNVRALVIAMEQDIDATQMAVKLSLDAQRNRMMQFDVTINIAGLAMAVGAYIGGVFGMNMENGLETLAPVSIPFMWWIFVMISGVCYATYMYAKRVYDRVRIGRSGNCGADDDTALVRLNDTLATLRRELDGRTEEHFSFKDLCEVLRHNTSYGDHDIRELVSLIFETFDTNQNGLISASFLRANAVVSEHAHSYMAGDDASMVGQGNDTSARPSVERERQGGSVAETMPLSLPPPVDALSTSPPQLQRRDSAQNVGVGIQDRLTELLGNSEVSGTVRTPTTAVSRWKAGIRATIASNKLRSLVSASGAGDLLSVPESGDSADVNDARTINRLLARGGFDAEPIPDPTPHAEADEIAAAAAFGQVGGGGSGNGEVPSQSLSFGQTLSNDQVFVHVPTHGPSEVPASVPIELRSPSRGVAGISDYRVEDIDGQNRSMFM